MFTAQILMGLLLSVGYNPIRQWPRQRWIKLFTLHNWLGICLDDHDQSHYELPGGQELTRLQYWFATRPQRYFGIFSVALALSEKTNAKPIWRLANRFHGIDPPAGMGAWWLSQTILESTWTRPAKVSAIARSIGSNLLPPR